MNVLLVGCGSICETWLKAIKTIPEITIVALVDLEVARANLIAQQYNLDVLISSDLAGALELSKADVVFDCTVPTAHYNVTLTALQAGCHVFGEKPMADSLEQAQQMIQVAQKANQVYAIMQNRRYDSNIQALKTFLDSKVIGEITTVHVDFFIGAHFGGFRDHMPHVLIKDMAIHTFDAARYLSDADATSVYCHEWNPKGSWYDQDASAIAIFEMTNDIIFNYRGSWCSEGLRTTWESAWRIIGTKGSVTWDGATGFQAEVVKHSTEFLSEMEAATVQTLETDSTYQGHAGAIRSFVKAIQSGQKPDTLCTDNIKSLAMVLKAVESAKTKERVLC